MTWLDCAGHTLLPNLPPLITLPHFKPHIPSFLSLSEVVLEVLGYILSCRVMAASLPLKLPVCLLLQAGTSHLSPPNILHQGWDGTRWGHQ